MKFTTYLWERWKTILLLAFAVMTTEIFLLTYQVNGFVHIYVALAVPAAFLLGVFLEYHAKKVFYDDVQGKLEQLEEKYLIVEMLGAAAFTEERQLMEILAETGKSMAEQVNAHKHIQQEYKDYIELWIHEIKLPIATAKMIIENNRNEVSESIGEELNRIEDYTEQALYYARSSYANKDYRITKCRLPDMVNEAVKRNKQTLINQHIRIVIENVDAFVYADAKWCHFILNQILANSIKYRKETDSEIRFFAEQGKESVVLHIRDNGIGIKASEVSKVFEKGFTGTNGRIGKKSTGIGLYLCKKLCDKLGLGIELDSEENVGTEVRLLFPKNSYFGEGH